MQLHKGLRDVLHSRVIERLLEQLFAQKQTPLIIPFVSSKTQFWECLHSSFLFERHPDFWSRLGKTLIPVVYPTTHQLCE